MDTSSVQTLKNIVKGIIFQGGYSPGEWKYMYQYAIDAVRDIHMFHSNKIKITKVNVATNTNTIDWPDDYIGFVYLAIPLNGKLWTLTEDNTIVPTTTLVNGQETLNPVIGEGVGITDGTTNGYGVHGAKNSLYYAKDETNRRFIINGANPANVLLAYISSGVENEETLIPVKYKNAIIYYTRWKFYERDAGMALQKAVYFKDLYEQEISKLVAFDGATLNEIYDALLSEYSGTIQR